MSTQRRRAARKNRPKRATPKPIPLPITSSVKIQAAFRRLGFIDGPTKGSSHQSMHRARADGGHDVISLVMGESKVPKGTLDGILKTGNVSPDEFRKALKRKR